jgi:hypothetical protein
MDCFVASLPCANASRLSQAMTAKLHEPAMPAKAGIHTLRLLDSITAVSGILDRPPQCAIAHKADDDD